MARYQAWLGNIQRIGKPKLAFWRIGDHVAAAQRLNNILTSRNARIINA